MRKPLVVLVILLISGTLPTAAQTPLTELVDGSYRGFAGGLYGGRNDPPPAQVAAARKALSLVIPRRTDGAPDPLGSIGFMAIGMSNTTEEFRWFERNEDANPLRQGGIVFINGAIGSHPSEFWADPDNAAWDTLGARIAAAGLSPAQVQVAWIKLARGTAQDLRFPQHAEQLRDDLREIVRHARAHYPNLRVAWLSSRIWGGWNINPQRNEPLSYESAFAVRWLIEDQITGDPLLSETAAPVLLWGPYLWAAGDSPRGDGLSWPRSDFEPDFIHPNEIGERKVGELLSAFFNEDPLAAPWFLAHSASRLLRLDVTADATIDQTQPATNFGIQSSLRINGTSGAIARSYLRFDLAGVEGPVVHALVRGIVGAQATPLMRQAGSGWTEEGITFANAPPAFGGDLGSPATFGTSFGTDATSAMQSPAPTLDLVIFSNAAALGQLRAKESGAGPYLLLRVPGDLVFESGFE